jgi:hypothetical protein
VVPSCATLNSCPEIPRMKRANEFASSCVLNRRSPIYPPNWRLVALSQYWFYGATNKLAKGGHSFHLLGYAAEKDVRRRCGKAGRLSV